jgi:hypothetical protein
MALSPNYSWSEPDNSSLVKNGAADIRTLGDAIDTSVWNVGFGQAGKNKIINGNCTINQRSFSTVTTTTGTLDAYGIDRFANQCLGGTGTVTHSVQQFTVGTAPVAGYEATQYLRIVTSGQTDAGTLSRIYQRIEDVRTFAGQTMTLSFWAKAATGTPNIQASVAQVFNSSADVVISSTKQAITTSWARYSFTFSVPSIAGKTLGANNYLNVRINVSAGSTFNSTTDSLGIQSNTFDIWGVQAEYGSKATPFQLTGGGDPQSELAMCQRYYQRHSGASANTDLTGMGVTISGADGYVPFTLFVPMRTAPSALDYSQIRLTDVTTLSVDDCIVTLASSNADFVTLYVSKTAAGFTLNRPCFVRVDASGNGYVGLSAEL